MIKLLRASGFGCYIASIFYGCFVYADDIFLLSASRTGLQALVSICDQSAVERGMMFSTNVEPSKSKTKCIAFGTPYNSDLAPIWLGGNPRNWVNEVKHLGNILQKDNSMKWDLFLKRCQFVGNSYFLTGFRM